jgi:hypothetical protein
MGKSSNGLDWTDIRMSMMELELAHRCVVSVVTSPAGTVVSGKMSVVAYAYQTAEGHLNGAPYVAVSGEFPHSGYKTLEGLVYRLLLDLDREIALGWYAQSELPF